MPNRKKKISVMDAFPPGALFSNALRIAKKNTLESLYDKTGLPLSWLRKFRAGEIKNPSVNRIETLLKAFGGFAQ
jgi:transcriptional regulator with XRE-family HTH domain